MTRFRVLGVFLLFSSLAASCAVIAISESVGVRVFGFDGPTSKIALDFLRGLPGLDISFFDVGRGDLKAKMAELLQLLQVSGITIIPPDLCLPCIMHGRTMTEVLVEYSSPTVGFFRGGVLTAVTLGVIDTRILSEALSVSSGNVQVFTYSGRTELKDMGLVKKLESFLLTGSGVSGFSEDVAGLILPVTFLALTDSVNPCTFMVFTAMLLITLQSVGRTRAAAAGLCFIYAVFAGYYVIGVAGISFFGVFQGVNKALALAGLVFGGSAVLSGLTGRSPIPGRLRAFLEERVMKTGASLAASFALGLFSAFTLLPCSSGPYVVGLGLLSVLKDTGQAYALLALYNLILVLPLIVILVAVAFSGTMAREVKVFRSGVFRRKGVIDVIEGVALIVICAYILLI